MYGSLVDKIDITALVSTYVMPMLASKGKSSRRGNIQKSFGIAGGQCVAVPEDVELTEKGFGATEPRVLSDTLSDVNVIKAMSVGWEIGKLMQVPFCQDDFLCDNPEHKDYFQFIKDRLGHHDRWASMSLCCLSLADGASVKAHKDNENCPTLSSVMNVSWVMPLKGSGWNRVSLVFCMRKSISDMLLRRAASSVFVSTCQTFLDSCAPYTMTNMKSDLALEAEAQTYYEEGVGSQGLIVALDDTTNKIVGLALLSKASCDKQANFLGPVAGSILSLMKRQKLTVEEVVELLFAAGLQNGFFSYMNLLGSMQAGWDRAAVASLPGGLVQHVVDEIVRVKGSLSGGRANRCQPFTTRAIKSQDVRDSCRELRRLVQRWSQLHIDDSQRQGRKETLNAMLDIRRLKGMGPFTSQHIVHLAALLGLAPKATLDFASVNDESPSKKKKSLHPALERYLKNDDTSIGDGKDGDTQVTGTDEGIRKGNKGVDTGRVAIVLSSATRYLAQKYPGVTESMAENMLCEAKRKIPACDLWHMGQCMYMRSKSCSKGWERVTPTAVSGKLKYVRSDLEDCNQFVAGEGDCSSSVCSSIWSNFSFPEGDGTAIPIVQKAVSKHREVRVPLAYLQAEHLGLMAAIRLAIAEHPGEGNSFTDYAKRLNSLSGLVEAISCFEGLPKTVQKYWMELDGPSNKRKHRKAPSASRQNNKKKQYVSSDESRSSDTSQTSSVVSDVTTMPFTALTAVPTYRECNGIVYRVYLEATQTSQVLFGARTENIDATAFDDVVVEKEWYTPNNDVYIGILSQTKSAEKSKVGRIKMCWKGCEESRKGNLIVDTQKTLVGTTYWAMLEMLPGLATPECLVCAAIAKSLGGVQDFALSTDETLGNGRWLFGNQKTAVHFILLCAICTLGRLDNLLYTKFIKRASSDQGKHIGPDQKVVGYRVEGSKEVGYYLVITGKGDSSTTLHIAFPSRNNAGGKVGVFCIVRLV